MSPSDNEEEWAYSSGDEIYEREDRTTLQKCRHWLNINKKVVSDWVPFHGFREYYQNWKDAIIETSQLRGEEIKVVDNKFSTKDVYTIEARHPVTLELLGFIRWSKGTIEISNFNSRLRRSALSIGASSKAGDDDLAGKHGEGFKMASAVMLRHGYRVRYEASDFYWNFHFDEQRTKDLYCNLTPMKPEKLEKLKKAYREKVYRRLPRDLTSNIFSDVTARIGKVQGQGTPVDKNDFLKWIKVTLDLDPPSSAITTEYGTLILDPTFKGRIYLKSLLMEGSYSRPFHFGYNFTAGKVNRDRVILADVHEQAARLALIWSEAIRLDEDATLPEFVKLLESPKPCGDIDLAEHYTQSFAAKKMWQYLSSKDPEKERFYYSVETGDKDCEFIRKSLKRNPIALQKTTWNILKKFNLVRSPQEESRAILENAPLSLLNTSTYSHSVVRALRAALALDSRTKDLNLEFRGGASTGPDLLLKGDCFLVNDKWLDFDASHEHEPCALYDNLSNQQVQVKQLECTHILIDLYDQIQIELSKSSDIKTANTNFTVRRHLLDMLNSMPGMVSAVPGDNFGDIKVTWIHEESLKASKRHGLDLRGQVILHRESTCSDKRNDLLVPDTEKDNSGQSPEERSAEGCGCPQMSVNLKDPEVVFSKLEIEEQYFPMVSRTVSQGFYGVSPDSTHPKRIYSHVIQPLQNNPPSAVPSSTDGDKDEKEDLRRELTEVKLKLQQKDIEFATSAVKENPQALEEIKTLRQAIETDQKEFQMTLAEKEKELAATKLQLNQEELESQNMQTKHTIELESMRQKTTDLNLERGELIEKCERLDNEIERLEQSLVEMESEMDVVKSDYHEALKLAEKAAQRDAQKRKRVSVGDGGEKDFKRVRAENIERVMGGQVEVDKLE